MCAKPSASPTGPTSSIPARSCARAARMTSSTIPKSAVSIWARNSDSSLDGHRGVVRAFLMASSLRPSASPAVIFPVKLKYWRVPRPLTTPPQNEYTRPQEPDKQELDQFTQKTTSTGYGAYPKTRAPTEPSAGDDAAADASHQAAAALQPGSRHLCGERARAQSAARARERRRRGGRRSSYARSSTGAKRRGRKRMVHERLG